MFDFGLFLTGIVVIFSIIGIACIGVELMQFYEMILEREIKRKIEKNGIGNRRLVG
jgi:hypothetical protein